MLDIASIKILSKDYVNKYHNITKKKEDNIQLHEATLPPQQQFKSWHERLSQFNSKYMFCLALLGVLLKHFWNSRIM